MNRKLPIILYLLLHTATPAFACAEFEFEDGYTLLYNTCNKTIYVRWWDSGGCSSGCGARVGGGGKQTVLVHGKFRWEERIEN